MADTVASILGPAVTELARWVGASIKRQFKYLCCFTTNIATLKKEAEYLQNRATDLQKRVDREKDDLQVISDEVKTWLRDSKGIKDEIDEIVKQVPNAGTGCLKLRARFSLSKRAVKTTDRLKELRDTCKSDADAISLPPPPASTQAIPLGRTFDFESRKQIEEDIMESLRVGDVNMMGICGMGGLGKTTMAKRVANRALEEHVFEEVVLVVVSQPLDKSRVQLEICGSLGLKLEGENGQTRLQRLHTRLSGSTKRILLVLDDLWEKLVLEELGIPTDHKGCTILSTSRNRDVLRAMNVQKVFGMDVLPEEDAWFLFRENAGTCVEDRKLNSVAKEVVNECNGLPIALTTVGAALRDEMNVGVWKDGLRQLRQCNPDIPELIANVYNPLKLSYDDLGPIQKSVFLLCCLYPEDVDIPLELLTYYCMGLGIFEAVGNVEEERNRMWALTNALKRRSLLLDGKNGDEYVRMHDVVRDVCNFIARQEGYIGGNDCSWISSTQSILLPTDLRFPKLRLLMWIGNSREFILDGIFREGATNLHVLFILEDYWLESLPLTTQSLKNLKTLVLERFQELDALSGIGRLVNLEILICRSCHSIKELPTEMKGLNRLKVLDLTGCVNLKRIGGGIISRLVGLEELKMLDSFDEWKAEELRELEALTNLRCLEIQIRDSALAAENMRLSSKMIKYDIRFSANCSYLLNNCPFEKKMSLVLEEESRMGHWIEMQLLRDVEGLLLEGNGAEKVDMTKSENIRWLDLRKCESMKKMVTSSMDNCRGATVLSAIEHLELGELPQLEEIYDGQISSNMFQNLKTLELDDLETLKQLWEGSSRGMDYLPQLEYLNIHNCQMMEHMFLWKGEDENGENSTQSPNSHHITTKVLPKLKTLELFNLPELTSLYKGIQRIEFPQLTRLEILDCRKLKVKVSKWKKSNENDSGGSSSKAQIQDLDGNLQEISIRCLKELSTDWNSFGGEYIDVSFVNGLEKLEIICYEGSMSVITPLIAENLFNLKELSFDYCDEMVKVIEDDEEKLVSGGERTLLFPKLEELELKYLRKLEKFCEWKCDVELPSLTHISITYCDNIKNFTLGLLATPNLKYVNTDSHTVELGVEEDLNEMVKQQYINRQMKKQQQQEETDGEEKGSEGGIEEEHTS